MAMWPLLTFSGKMKFRNIVNPVILNKCLQIISVAYKAWLPLSRKTILAFHCFCVKRY